ncbi:MAG: cell division protein FtsQ/DivIB [Methylophilaceae bacterium]
MWDKPQALNWVANLLYASAFVMFLYGLLFVVIHLPIFPLRELKVDGEMSHVTREQVKLIVGRYIQGNFFTLDLEKTRDAFEKLPWARNVSVRRRWPDKLEVVIEEHKELARWGNIALVNTYGELFHAASDSDLPVFFGPGDGVREVAEYYSTYSRVLGNTGMKVEELALSPRRAWQIKTDKGLVIELGREQMELRLEKFARVYQNTLAGLGGNVKYADLRYPNGFAVRRPLASKVTPAKSEPVKAIPGKVEPAGKAEQT